jgi:hypothetical protein
MTFNAGTYVDSTGTVVAGSAFDGSITINGADGSSETITGGSRADSISGGTNADTLTGGNGADTLVGGGGVDAITLTEGTSAQDLVSLTDVLVTANRDVITGFTSGTDKLGLDTDYTTVGTAASSAAVVNIVADVTEVTAAAYNLTAISSTATNDVYILAGGNEANCDLSSSQDGTELFKYLGTTGSAANAITVAATGNAFYLAAYDAGSTYLYQVTENAGGGGADIAVAIADIALVGVLSGTATVVATDFTMVA